MDRARARAGIFLAAAGMALLGLSLIGRLTALGKYESFPPRPWERFDPRLAALTQDLFSLYRAAQARAPKPLQEMPAADMIDVLQETVSDRFTHGDRATYNPFSNWILWTMGIVVPRYRDIQDPDTLLRGGHSALCGDVSYILMQLAGMAGIPTRHVLLEGHIVMEASYDGAWHAYDPDIEVYARDDAGGVLSAGILARQPDHVRRSYAGHGDPAYIESIVAIYTSEADNGYRAYPARSLFGPRGQRPGRIEQAALFAVYLVPVTMIAAGIAMVAACIRKKNSL